MRDLSRLVMIVTIIERGCGNKLTKLYDREQVFTHVRCEGTGTATSEIMDILGLGSSEKDIILSLAPAGAARALLDKLGDDLHDNSPGRASPSPFRWRRCRTCWPPPSTPGRNWTKTRSMKRCRKRAASL